jgi:TPR repeat protein
MNADAQNNLGVMYFNGDGVPKNYKTAAKWWKLAAEQGDNNAQNNLKKIKSRLVSKGIDDCLFDEIKKVTGPETKKIVEKYCRRKLEKKSLDWLLRKYN